jgi:putative PIN family toxin of toxin-antitoxin system
LRVVLDTNILISALIFPGGEPEAVYRLAIERRIDLVTSPALLAELGRILTEKFGWDATRAEEAVAQIARIGVVVEPRERVLVIEEDPADDRVLEAAAEGDAEFIVSGDRHLLRFGSWRGIRIRRASAFLDEFE